MTPNDYYLNPSIVDRYDLVTRIQPIVVDDIPFYVDLAREAAAQGQGVLELGCGTGRVTIPVAQTGARTTGLESSPLMLDVARGKSAKAGVDVTWVEGDMASFRLDERFELAIIPFRSFLMLLTSAEQKSCLACIRDHLVDGGRLALNIFNPDLVMIASWLSEKRGTWQRNPRSSEPDRELASLDYHTSTQELFERQADLDSDSSAIITRTERNLRLRYVFRYEMEYLLELSGFEVEALYGWFDKRPFDDASDEMVWVARKG